MHNELIGVSGALCRVWQRFFNLPLTGRWKKVAEDNGRQYEAAAIAGACWLTGVSIALIGVLLSVLFNRFVGAAVFVLLAYGALLKHDRGSGDGMIAQIIASKLPGEYIPFDLIIPILTVLVKLFLLAVIFFYGSPWFLGCVFAGGAAMEVYLAGEMQVSPPLIDASGTSRKRFWVVLGAVFIISFFISALAASCGVLAFVLLWKYAAGQTAARGITLQGIRGYGAICVWLMLIAGVLTI
ncbi:MAG: hypothetical protein E7053_02475 [Lentisphaerae bacterium]|nr:hypothetical protein [Lentisphaerota bacterium]